MIPPTSYLTPKHRLTFISTQNWPYLRDASVIVICNSINITNNISVFKEKIHKVCRKQTFDNIQHSFLMNAQESRLEGTYLNNFKVMYDKPTPNIILNRGKT